LCERKRQHFGCLTWNVSKNEFVSKGEAVAVAAEDYDFSLQFL
jgi:hypothetical protein